MFRNLTYRLGMFLENIIFKFEMVYLEASAIMDINYRFLFLDSSKVLYPTYFLILPTYVYICISGCLYIY